VFAEMIQSMGRDGPRATWLSFGLVVVVTAFGTRSRRALFSVLGSLIAAVLWMIGFAAWGDLKLNFLNFVAIPLTFGIGVEYAINLYDRIVVEGGDVARGIRSVGGAVILCSLTTILGYGSLLFADNRALVSFGHYAILGETTCIVSALLLMPALFWLTTRVRPLKR
jgi:predicted RND superfamily exporter protein